MIWRPTPYVDDFDDVGHGDKIAKMTDPTMIKFLLMHYKVFNQKILLFLYRNVGYFLLKKLVVYFKRMDLVVVIQKLSD